MGVGLTQFLGQIVDVDLAAGGHDGEPAAGVFQLAHVTRPGQGCEIVGGFLAQDLGLAAQFTCGLYQKVARQQGDVDPAVGETRQVNTDDVEAMVEVLPENAPARPVPRGSGGWPR